MTPRWRARQDGVVAVESMLDTFLTLLLLAEDDGLGEIVVSQSSCGDLVGGPRAVVGAFECSDAIKDDKPALVGAGRNHVGIGHGSLLEG